MQDGKRWITWRGRRILVNNKGNIEKKKNDINNIIADNFQDYIKKRKEKIKDIKYKEIKYGGNLYKIQAKDSNDVVGYVDFYDDKDHISISSIFVNEDYRRIGIATQIYKQLQAKYPEKDIHFGALTDDGEKLLRKIADLKENEYGEFSGKIKR